MRTIPEKETLTVEFKSDIECLDDKELVSEIIGRTGRSIKMSDAGTKPE